MEKSYQGLVDELLLGDPKGVLEASLSRLYQQASGREFGIVSAWVESNSPAENKVADAELRRELSSRGLGYVAIDGHWEGTNSSPAYFVPGLRKDLAVELMYQFGQEAVIHSESGTASPVLLIRTGGQEEDMGEFHLGQITQAFFSWKGRAFVFESAS